MKKEVNKKLFRFVLFLVPAATVILFIMIGLLCPSCPNKFQLQTNPLPWPQSILPYLQLHWTLAAGIFFGGLIFLVNKKLKPYTMAITNLIWAIILLTISVNISLIFFLD